MASTGKHERASTARSTADSDFGPALVNRAVLVYEQGDLDAALSDLTRALELLGDDADVLYNRGVALQQTHRFAEAVRDFTRALALPEADRRELLARRAECLVACGEAAQAEGDLVALRELDDRTAAVVDALASVSTAERDGDDA